MHKVAILISGALLGLFGIIGAGLVGLSHEGTAARIAQNERDALLRQLEDIVPTDGVDNDLLNDVTEVSAPEWLGAETTRIYRGRKAGEDAVLILNPVMIQGYSGLIKLIIAVKADGVLSGVRVLSHRETPGLGDKVEIERSDWVLGFDGKSLLNPGASAWRVKRDGGVFDQFTGATITPRTIVKRVRSTLEYLDSHALALFQAAAIPPEEDG